MVDIVASCYGAIIGIFWIFAFPLQGTVLNIILIMYCNEESTCLP